MTRYPSTQLHQQQHEALKSKLHILKQWSVLLIVLGIFVGFCACADPNSDIQQHVFGWGLNSHNQLGGDTILSTKTFRTADLNQTIVSASAGGAFSLFLTDRGEAYCVGDNARGACAQGDKTDVKVPTSVHNPESFLHQKRIAQVAAGFAHSVFLTEDGQVAAAGDNAKGQLGLNLSDDLSLLAQEVKFDNVFEAQNIMIMQVDAGEAHTLFLASSGEVAAVGDNSYGALCIGKTPNIRSPKRVALPQSMQGATIAQVAAGSFHTLILTSQGHVVVCGRHNVGQLGIASFADQHYNPEILSYLSNRRIVDIAAGSFHSIFLADNGELYATGLNNYGALAIGTTMPIFREPAPVKMSAPALNGKSVVNIAAGSLHSLFVTSDGSLALAGSNFAGQLFSGSRSFSNVAVSTNFVDGKLCHQMDGGNDYTLAVCANSIEAIHCPPGMYKSEATCVKCPKGHMCIGSEKTLCKAGTFAPTGSWKCFACPAGSASFLDGSSVCEMCPKGSFSSEEGSTACTRCEEGTYSSEMGSISCKACAAGMRSNSQRGSTGCVACPAGSYRAETDKSCINCPAGTYSFVAGAPSRESCLACPAGRYSVKAGADSESKCMPCAEGFISPVPGAKCQSCLDQCSNADRTICVPCRSGVSGARRVTGGGLRWIVAMGVAGLVALMHL